MNKQYVAMVIRQILTNYGDEIISNHSKFKAVIYDFVNETFYHEERLVIKHAMEAPAFWRLLSATSLTAEEAGKFVEQIIKENYMSREGAKFIVECVAEARGGIKDDNPTDEIITESDNSNNFPRNSDVGKEDIAGTIGLKCTMKMNGRKKQRGEMFLYQDRLIFAPDTTNSNGTYINKNEQYGELLYSDISEAFTRQHAMAVTVHIIIMLNLFMGLFKASQDMDELIGLFFLLVVIVTIIPLIGYCITRKELAVITVKGLRINFKFTNSADMKHAVQILKVATGK